jgi:hypothetical protein
MKARIVSVMVLAAVLLLGGTAPAAADEISGVTGGINMAPPWGHVWIEFSVHQVDPSSGEATGMIMARVDNPVRGTKHLWYEPKCVSFTEVGGKPAAILVATIVRREGWEAYPGAGDPGEHLKWRVVDGGTPGVEGDLWSLQWYQPGVKEYWPADSQPSCSDYQATGTLLVTYGNLVIH